MSVGPAVDVALRPLPYPFRAALAICSDLDETPDRRVYHDIAKFLNTTAETSMGPGIGLEVGNTIYFDMAPGQFAWLTTDDAGRSMIRAMIDSGHIDCLHSYGDLATSRADAGRALDELARLRRKIEIWIDHAIAPTNFGADIMRGIGDVPGYPAYHADLTCGYGVKYVWRGRVTSVLGQDVAPKLRGIFDPLHPAASTRTIAKEAAKHLLGRRGNPKYDIHPPNRILRKAQLRDGRPVIEFLRCNPHYAGVSVADTGRGIGQVLTQRMLTNLEASGGICILYTHLGKICRPDMPFDASGIAGLRRLAEAHHGGRILVTTTRRLIGYCRCRSEIDWNARRRGDDTIIDIRAGERGERSLHPDDFAGLTFYVSEPQRTRMQVDGRDIADLRINPPDHTRRASVSVRWSPLEFPSL